MRKLCLFVLAIAMIFTGLATAQEVGDYRSVISGIWRSTATWEMWDGSSWVTPTLVPKLGNNVLIRTGHIITFSTSPDTCKNLVVESGAMLYNNNTTGRYLNVYGDSVINNGTIGAPTDGFSFQCNHSVKFAGIGNYRISRLRAGIPSITIAIDRNFELHYNAAAPNNVALYSNNQSGVTFQVNDGDTLLFTSPATFSFSTNSTGYANVSGSFYNYGTVIMPSGSNFNISVGSGFTSLLHVYGTLVLGDTLIADAITPTTGSETVMIDGNIVYTSTDTMKFDHLYTNNPSGVSFGFPVRINRNLSIGWGDYNNGSGLTLADSSTIARYYGALAYAPTFEGGINLIYGESPVGQPLYTSLELTSAPAIYDAYFDNSYGVYLNSTMTCLGAVTMYDGVINASGNILGCYNQPVRNTGYLTNGMLGIMIPAGDNTISYYVGTDNGYSPATLDFKNVTTPNGVGVTCFGETHSEVNYSTETLQRYWEIGYDPANPVAFDSCSIEFQYLPEDFNTEFIETDDEATMVVGQYDNDEWTWAFPEISARTIGENNDGGSIKIANLTSFSDFTMGKNQSSIAADETPPTIVATYPANGDSDVALDAPIFIAFSEPMDTLSLAGSMTPSPNEQPTWNATMDTIILIHDPMALNTTYTVSITGANDLAGNPLAVLPDSFMFTTIAGDTVKPYITGTNPADGDSNVTLNEIIYFAFSEPINPSSFGGKSIPDFPFTPSWSINFDTLWLAPDTLYDYNTTYTLICSTGTDMSGNPLTVLPDSISFTTIVGDTIKPFIVSTSPTDGAVDVLRTLRS